jgi:hypothetical protein
MDVILASETNGMHIIFFANPRRFIQPARWKVKHHRRRWMTMTLPWQESCFGS